MDWGPKAALWDFTESGQQRRSGFGGVDQRDCKEAAQVPSGVGRLVKRPKSAEAAGVGASGRSNNKGSAAATCAVDGCISDLSLCRDYHRRHKVCEEHAKTPVVLVGGKQQRFCQQCSRFHLLVEFDEGKRSCRKRLDCHNRRRRKPQHPLVYSSGLLPDYRYHQGQRFVPYPPDASLAARQKRDWGSAVQHNEQGCIPNFGSFNPNNHSAGPVGTYQHVQQHETKHQQFPSPQNNGTAIMTESPAAAAENTVHVGCSVPSSKPFPRRMNSFCHDHDAPSLLSSSTSTSSMQASSILVPHIVPIAADPVPPTFQPHPHALLPRLGSLDKFAGLQQDAGAVSFTGISYLDADISDAAAILVPDTGSSDFSSIPIFDAGADGSSDGTSQDLPFIWR